MPVIPRLNDKEVKKFCKSINKNAESEIVDIVPFEKSELLNCVGNVQEYISQNGGSSVVGWAIWLEPQVLIEAEFKQVLFIEDPILKYENTQINNIRKNISKSPLVDTFIKNCNEIFRLTNKDDLMYQYGEIILENEDAEIYEKLHNENHKILMDVLSRRKLSPNDHCLCGSGLKYKKCCGSD